MRIFYITKESKNGHPGEMKEVEMEGHLENAPISHRLLKAKVGELVSEEDIEWVDEYYCTEPGCKIPDRCLHQGKPTLCGQEKKPCDYCEGKGWYINEDHKKYPKVQQKLDCWYCLQSGQSKIAVHKKY